MTSSPRTKTYLGNGHSDGRQLPAASKDHVPIWQKKRAAPGPDRSGFFGTAAQLRHTFNTDQGDDKEPEEFAECMHTRYVEAIDRIVEQKSRAKKCGDRE